MFKGMDMYKKKGGNDLEFFIQMFDGQYSPPALKVAPTYAIPYGTTMSMVGNTTFDSLKNSFDAEKDDGLKERMLWGVYRSRDVKNIPFDRYLVGKWEDRIYQILNQRNQQRFVKFPPQFENKFLEWKLHKAKVAGLSNYLAK
jgi:histone acetyltransferase (RNA polymerase elongator complex component)